MQDIYFRMKGFSLRTPFIIVVRSLLTTKGKVGGKNYCYYTPRDNTSYMWANQFHSYEIFLKLSFQEAVKADRAINMGSTNTQDT